MKLRVKPETIVKQYEAWTGEFESNNHRGEEAVMFGLAGEQWPNDVASDRFVNNKETLTFNLCLKHLRRIKAQSKEIEFSLGLAPTTQIYQNDVEQTNTFRLLLNSIMLSNNVLSVISKGLDVCVEFGYSFYEVNFERENAQTLCLIPVIRTHNDQRCAFWDLKARRPTKIDGRFCGLHRKITREEFLMAYPQYKTNDNWLYDDGNEVIDYWYRDYHKKKFFKLEGDVYKREDLLTADDMELIQKDENEEFIFEESEVCCIYFMRICNNKTIQKPEIFPTDDLPLVYHFALTMRTKDGERTYPFIYSMEGAQKLHNYVMSQVATMAKNSTGEKWIFTPDHVGTEQYQFNARQINMREGGFVFGKDKDGDKPQRIQPTEISQTMMALAGTTKQEIDEIAGAMIDTQQAQQAVISGTAIDKITNNIDILQAPILASHIEVVNDIGRLYRQMIPRLYTETRTLVVKTTDGNSEAVVINEKLATDRIKNNIKDIDNNFHYEIKAGPSSAMINENIRKALLAMYQIDPQAFKLTADIFVRTLDVTDQEEISRRLSTMVDPQLIAYSQGKISRDQFDKYQAQQMEKRKAEMQQDPQAQSMVALGQAENTKAQAQAFDSQTKRQVAMANMQNNQMKLQLEWAKLESLSDDRAQKGAIELQQQIRENAKVIAELMNMGSSNASTTT